MKSARRSKWAADIMFRLWDNHNETWVSNGSKSIWTHKKSVQNVRQKMIKEIGRNPDHLVIYSVSVEVVNESAV